MYINTDHNTDRLHRGLRMSVREFCSYVSVQPRKSLTSFDGSSALTSQELQHASYKFLVSQVDMQQWSRNKFCIAGAKVGGPKQ